MEERRATVQRETRETKVSVELCLDGTGQYSVNTGNGFFDHLLSQLARHSLMDLTIEAHRRRRKDRLAPHRRGRVHRRGPRA